MTRPAPTLARPLTAPGPSSPLPEVRVEITVTAPTRTDAIHQAVRLGVDALLALTVKPGTPLARQVRRTVPDDLARVVRIVREDMSGDGVTLTAVVALPHGVAERALITARPDLARTRVAVLVPECVQHRSLPDPVAEAELRRALGNAGLTVTDEAPALQLSARALLRDRPLDPAHLRTVQRALNADILVTGEASTGEHRAVTGGTHTCVAHLTVHVIDLSRLRMLLRRNFRASGLGVTEAAAGRTALVNVGRTAGETLPGAVLLALQSEPRPAHTYRLHIPFPVTVTAADTLVQRLSAHPDVRHTLVRARDAAGLTVDLTCGGTATELATVLETCGLTVTGRNGRDLTARL